MIDFITPKYLEGQIWDGPELIKSINCGIMMDL